MKKSYLILMLSITTLIYSCKKDNEVAPDVNLFIKGENMTSKVNTKIAFAAGTNNGVGFNHQWKLDGKIVSTAYNFDFTPATAGTYVIEYTASNSAGSFSHKYTVSVPVPVVAIGPNSTKFITTVFDYLPGPGQFVNESLGNLAGAQKIIGDVSQTGLVSLGGFGGYVIFGFDHSVVNNAGADLAIYGNPIGGTTPWAEPGIVMVSQDVNGNGKPDDEWYELAGSEYNNPLTIKNYEITYTNPKGFANVSWTDNQGNSGTYDVNNFHKHNYYPEFAPNQEKLTFKGTLLPSSWGKNGSIFINSAFPWGYTDSWSADDDYATKRYNSFDLDWAVDKNGKKIALNTIDFVKVYTGQREKGNTLLGEISTEVKGAMDLGIK
ncbi:PKD domain-containing protein [Pedobacter miscanthi]|uniref:PKD domain-containing protein n=1 Tax=Pedobacter miscanthi TaxID=2259170 RepID=A0A366KNF5_9SPHI|nr:PKD domain-containing protein [Pedobacter miscanthi]RBQ03217.1 PKD domain-containing protein [Pedobacter miscanthi]